MRFSGFRLSVSARRALITLIASTLISAASAASAEKIVHAFSNIGDGIGPTAPLTAAGGGVFFGTTLSGGTGKRSVCKYGCGTIFELRRTGNGWTKTTIYSFRGDSDGWYPNGGMILDNVGNLYGTTHFGGAYGLGTAFELSPSGGTWKETILYSFGSYPSDGVWPIAGMISDSEGNLYGTTGFGGGGTKDGGTVFELVRSTGWTENILHVFGNGSDGSVVVGGLVMDSAGNLFGTTDEGGTGSSCFYGCGIVFELTPSLGTWSESVLHNFTGNPDGASSESGLIFDDVGNLYGVTEGGGTGFQCENGPCGTVFEIVRGSSGTWTETVLYSFGSYQNDAWEPISALTMDKSGNLYGATYQGGTGFCIGGCGAVFKLVPSSSGWSESLLHSFLATADGRYPGGGVVLDSAGNLYGTTGGGGPNNLGIVYEVVP